MNYMVSEGTISVVFEDGEQKSLSRTHSHAQQLLDALHFGAGEPEIKDLFSKANAIKRYMSGNITVNEDGELLYKGAVVNHVVGQKIVQFMRDGLPYEPLVKFLDKLLENPSYKSIEQLYTFLVNQDIRLDAEGYLICYKAVRSDYMDKHTGTFDNHVGKRPEIPRNWVDDNSGNACSRGLHVGSIAYVRGFASPGDCIVMVRVNPKDVVSVPSDCSCQKMRVCVYDVTKDMTGVIIPDVATSPLYDDDGDVVPGYDVLECSLCGSELDENDNYCHNPDCDAYVAPEDANADADELQEVDVGGVTLRVKKGSGINIDKGEDGQLIVTVDD